MDVSEYTTSTAGEEADTSCRNHDSAAVHSNHDSHSNKSAKERSNKTDQYCSRCEREDSRTINCRFGVRDVFLRDCNECCGDLCDELTNTINKNAHTSRKLQTLQERIDEPDIVSGFLKNNIHMSVYNASDYCDIEQNYHEQSYREYEVSEQLKEFRHIHVACVTLLFVSASFLEQ